MTMKYPVCEVCVCVCVCRLLFSVRFVAHCNVRFGLEQEIYSELLGEMLVTAELAPPIPAAEALADELLTTPAGRVELPLLLLLVLLLPACDDEVVALLVKVRKAFIHLVFIDPAELLEPEFLRLLSFMATPSLLISALDP